MKTANTEIFNAEVRLQSHAQPVAVMFTAPWCGPCKSMKPVIERLEQEIGIEVFQVCAGTERALCQEFGIRAVPTLAVLRDGAVAAMNAGAVGEQAVRDFFTKTGVIT